MLNTLFVNLRRWSRSSKFLFKEHALIWNKAKYLCLFDKERGSERERERETEREMKSKCRKIKHGSQNNYSCRKKRGTVKK